ncbi:hypothetical protein AYL99_11897 [Fonsecaea erecta]|uniref:JmjC domain-containing protein n=1 Tax=Fonsecaea erecta TaxID=1367422 RepID=A0A178Z444_9EURO|nr:hypothetical protein AYL99_11897 [Fonsecaea erecta]OAP53875.1 hypothetical protein AYL99_11897 [Fonsecaea erecta]
MDMVRPHHCAGICFSTTYRITSEPLECATWNINDFQLRGILGLPEKHLSINHRPLSVHDGGSKVYSHHASLNNAQFFTSMSKKALDLQSLNILWYGQPTIWVVIPPRHAARLEARVAQEVYQLPRCGQFVRHSNVIVSPSELIRWGVMPSVFAQFPGEVVKIEENAYYFTWKTGPSLSETMNCCDVDWLPPPLYRDCATGTGCASELLSSSNASVRSHARSLSRHSPEAGATREPVITQVEDAPLRSDGDIYHQEAEGNFVGFRDNGSLKGSQIRRTGAPDALAPWFVPYSDTQNLPNPDNCLESSNLMLSEYGMDFLRHKNENLSTVMVNESGSSDPFYTCHTSPYLSPELLTATDITEHWFEADTQVRGIIGQGDISNEYTWLDDPGTMGYAWQAGRSRAKLHGQYAITPVSSGPTQPAGPPPTSLIVARAIDALTALGLRHEGRLLWKTNKTVDVRHILDTFRRSAPLDDNTVFEILHILTVGRNDVYVGRSDHLHRVLVETYESPTSMVFFPIRQGNHSFLLSVNGLDHIVTIHDNLPHDDVVSCLASAGVADSCWDFQYKQILADDGLNSALILLYEAEMLLRGDVEVIEDLSLLRLRYLRLLLGDLLAQESLSYLTCDSATLIEGITTFRNGTTDLQRGDLLTETRLSQPRRHLDVLASAIGCATVLQDLKAIAQNLRSSSAWEPLTLKSIMQVFDHGEANRSLRALQKNVSWLLVARSFRALTTQMQKVLRKNKEANEEAKKFARQWRGQETTRPARTEESGVVASNSGVDAKSMAYDWLIKYWGHPPEDRADPKKRVQRCNYLGRSLMLFEDVCGLDFPLWMLLPLRSLLCSSGPGCPIDPDMLVFVPLVLGSRG